MEKEPMEIKTLEIGTLVKHGPEYAKVTECVHGTLYYSYLGGFDTLLRLDFSEVEIDAAVTVSDWDEDKVSECCG